MYAQEILGTDKPEARNPTIKSTLNPASTSPSHKKTEVLLTSVDLSGSDQKTSVTKQSTGPGWYLQPMNASHCDQI